MSVYDYFWYLGNNRNAPDYQYVHGGTAYAHSGMLTNKNTEPLAFNTQFLMIERDMPFEDFTFVCADGEVKAHRCILWTRCELFKTDLWTIDDISEITTEFDVRTVNKILDYIYGGRLNIHNPIDIDGYLFLNYLTPSINNICRLLPISQSSFVDVLNTKDKLDYANISINKVIYLMANYVINAYRLENYSSMLPFEVVSAMIENDYINLGGGEEPSVAKFVIRYSIDAKLDDAKISELCSKIRWAYIEYDYGIGYLYKFIPKLTIEQIKDAYLKPKYRHELYEFRYLTSNYNTSRIIVLNKTYEISKLFSANEYKLVLRGIDAMRKRYYGKSYTENYG